MNKEQIIEILNKISQESGYDFHFENVDISLVGKQFTIKGNITNNLVFLDNKVGIFPN